MSTEHETHTRISGCLGRDESVRLLFELADLVVRLEVPFRIARQKWGRGWALYAVSAPDVEITKGRNPEILFALAAAVGQRERARAS
jgi:hypothetical protein